MYLWYSLCCVCTIHQNVKLMLDKVHLPEMSTYHHYLSKIKCNPPSPSCIFGGCGSCPNIQSFNEEFIELLENYSIDEVLFKQWVSTDRSTLETYCEKLVALRRHSFLAKKQSDYFASRKSSLKPGEILVNADFSENYSFVLQDAAQGFHWNNYRMTWIQMS